MWPRTPADRERVVLGMATAVFAVVTGTMTLDVLRNLPYDPVVVPGWIQSLAATGSAVASAVALVAVALATRQDAVRVGLLFAGVFGLLVTFDAGATLPAAAAVVGGGGLALLGGLGRPATYRRLRRSAIAAMLVVGIGLSLASTIGLAGPGYRGIGGAFALVGVTGIGIHMDGDWIALGVTALVFALVAFASATAPFVAGSALLVGFAVVDVPHLLVALAFGSASGAAFAGLRRRDYGLAVGAGLLVFAGIPATLPRAMAVVLGATLVLVPARRLLGEAHDGANGGRRSKEVRT